MNTIKDHKDTRDTDQNARIEKINKWLLEQQLFNKIAELKEHKMSSESVSELQKRAKESSENLRNKASKFSFS